MARMGSRIQGKNMEIRWNLSGEEIERESFRAIEAECDLHAKLPAPEWRVKSEAKRS